MSCHHPLFPMVSPCLYGVPMSPMSPHVTHVPLYHPHVPMLSPSPPCLHAPHIPCVHVCVSLPRGDGVLAGLCVAVPQRVTVTQDVRVALRLPPSARPREQLQLQPLIHSRLPRSINVSSPNPPDTP